MTTAPPDPFIRALIVTLWLAWAFCVTVWFVVSTVVYVTQHDAGSFIGGGIVVIMLVLVPGGLTVVDAMIRRGT